MNNGVAATFIAVGILIVTGVFISWYKTDYHKERSPKRHFIKLSTLSLFVGGGMICLGCGYLFKIPVLDAQFGSIPVWAFIEVPLIIFWIWEVFGKKDDRLRTPILGAIVAGILMLGTGHMVITSVSHGIQHAQVTGVYTPGKK
jgi:hypothetical protein